MDQDLFRGLVLFVNAGVRVLSARITLLLTLLLCFSLFWWEMYDPNPFRLAAASIFAVVVFLPVLALDKRQAADKEIVKGD